MALFNIAYKNISKNLKNYSIYIFSMVFSVVIFFIFKSIQYNAQIEKVLSVDKKIGSAFNAAATVIAIFAAIFIWYSNSFFIKKRKKEIGLYSLLGIEKKQIGTMLFYETLVIGIISIVLGVVIGMFLSKFFIQILVNIINLGVNIKFVLSSKAIYSTVQIFLILFILISFHGYTIIYRFELIDLFKAESKAEKEPKASFIKAVISIILIAAGYFKYLTLISRGGNFELSILFTFVTVVIGTYLLFDSFLLFIIRKSKYNKKKYFKGLNMMSTSQLLYRIRGNSKTLATIAILSAATLTAIGVSTSFMQDFNNKFDKQNKFSYITNIENREVENKIKETINNSNNSLKSEIEVEGIDLNFKMNSRVDSIKVIKESTFIKIIQGIGKKDDFKKLNNNDEVILFDEFYNPKDKIRSKLSSIVLAEKDEEKRFKIIDFREGTIFNERISINTVVVKDAVYDKYKTEENRDYLKCYLVDNHKKSRELTKELEKITAKEIKNSKEGNRKFLNSYYNNYMEQSTSTGVLMFIGTFLGLVFLACTGSIMFFKQVSEAEEEKYRYKILRNIGASEEEIKRSIYKQVFFVFASPLVVGCIHSLVAVYLIADSFSINMITLFLMSYVPYIIIYLIYYMLTSNYYYNAIKRC